MWVDTLPDEIQALIVIGPLVIIATILLLWFFNKEGK